MTKLAKKKTAIKKGPAKVTAKIPAKTPAINSDDAKRLARNAKLREWRASHADQQRAYMAEWRANRNVATGSNTSDKPSSRIAQKPATPKPTTPTTNATKGGDA
jgi:hypothetical protein